MKRIIAFVLLCSVLFCGLAGATFESKAESGYMKRLGVPMDLEEGESYTFTQRYAGLGKKEFTWTLTDLKQKKSKKSGYLELSYVITYQQPFEPDADETDKILQTAYFKKYGNVGSQYWFAVVDGSNGMSLETQNDKDVTVTTDDLDFEANSFWGRDTNANGTEIIADLWKIKVTVVYPKSYQDLCIGFGGGNDLRDKESKADQKFWDGKAAFGKTTYYKKGKTNSRWMMVR